VTIDAWYAIGGGIVFGLTWYLVNPRRPFRNRNALIAGLVFGGLGLIVAMVRAASA
jgi:hypothetical protein